ncbi:MAG: phosphoribosylanthranilate isomerase [Pyrobaculum sp.]|uniref:phosphoribosylanthranilate isomerase n=1 Tax=Pyrobaculum sp. 3827-6 TaxID=2983604 RepID=UPI0021DB3B47|nr:N-(5'-phosphoribosyl)anthranilate isomerase [Pyrobaculum sp. 3827-6]MCU7787036.1 N-(5'-phosphoribosyl)anthranilate isomerase [Pyrobaculum sp. 3827-6]
MPLVKICGVARQTDAEALDGLVEYIGFIVEPASPRSVDAAKLAALRGSVYRSKAVLVTASMPPRDAVDTAARLEIPVVQHHGRLAPGDYDYAEERGVALAPVAVYRPGAGLRREVEELLKLRHEYVLVDADKKSRERYEGGLKIPLSALAEVVHLGKVAVAGGVTPENAHLVAGLRPYMVDVASGVEDAPGVKNMEKVRALLKALGR